MTTIERVRGSDPVELAAIDVLRNAAWGPIVGDHEAAARFGIDEHDRDAWHCVVHHGTELVAAGRLTAHDDCDQLPEAASFGPYRSHMHPPFGLGSRIVVHPDHRGRGFAEMIIADRLALAADLGLVEVWSETRRVHHPGMTRHGYEHIGPSVDRSVPGEWVVLRATVSA